jgi:hypothetical protein
LVALASLALWAEELRKLLARRLGGGRAVTGIVAPTARA